MAQRNVSIRSLLDASDTKDDTPNAPAPTNHTPLENAASSSNSDLVYPKDPVQSLVAQYQTSVGFPEFTESRSTLPRDSARAGPSVVVAHQAIAPKVEPPTNLLQNYVKKFQIDFQTTSDEKRNELPVSSSPASPVPALMSPTPQLKDKLAPTKLRSLKPAFQIKPTTNKHSIDSIINLEDAQVPFVKEKKRPLAKTELANKKAKLEPKKTIKPAVKTDTKKVSKTKKKTPETMSQDKPSIHPTMTLDKSQSMEANVVVPPASFITPDSEKLTSGPDSPSNAKAKEKPSNGLEANSLNDAKEKDSKDKSAKDSKEKENKDKDKGKNEKESVAEVPVIALNIPLLNPNNPQPGKAEVVINVLKLSEDKYGWNTIHPNAKSAIDLMDDILDDDEEGEEEEDEDVSVADEKAIAVKKKEELTEEQLIKRHETKMNRKVGKYDFDDPFIDDAELQWEEEITTTKEGFFVYWGPLVEEKSATKKGVSKSKK